MGCFFNKNFTSSYSSVTMSSLVETLSAFVSVSLPQWILAGARATSRHGIRIFHSRAPELYKRWRFLETTAASSPRGTPTKMRRRLKPVPRAPPLLSRLSLFSKPFEKFPREGGKDSDVESREDIYALPGNEGRAKEARFFRKVSWTNQFSIVYLRE